MFLLLIKNLSNQLNDNKKQSGSDTACIVD